MLHARLIDGNHEPDYPALSPYSDALATLEHETPETALDDARRDWEDLSAEDAAFNAAREADQFRRRLRQASRAMTRLQNEAGTAADRLDDVRDGLNALSRRIMSPTSPGADLSRDRRLVEAVEAIRCIVDQADNCLQAANGPETSAMFRDPERPMKLTPVTARCKAPAFVAAFDDDEIPFGR